MRGEPFTGVLIKGLRKKETVRFAGDAASRDFNKSRKERGEACGFSNNHMALTFPVLTSTLCEPIFHYNLQEDF